MNGVEFRIPIEKPIFAALLRQETEHLPEVNIPRDETVLRYVETSGSKATGRWLIVEIKWEGDRLMIGWPPLAVTKDCGF